MIDRLLRIAVAAGLVAFAGFWGISVRLESEAAKQPIANGPFQHAYPFKGHVGFLTDGQAMLGHVAHVLAYGWWIAAFAGIWVLISDRNADKARLNLALSQFRPGREH
jgi:hypothetical protein